MITVSLPSIVDRRVVESHLTDRDDIRLIGWDLVSAPDSGVRIDEIDVVVLPFHTTSRTPNPGYVGIDTVATALEQATNAKLVQLVSVGAEGIEEHLPPNAMLANAVGVMERQTAELACTLLLAAFRGLHTFIGQKTWANVRTPGMIGRRVVILGSGGVGNEVYRRLVPFDAELVTVATTARTRADGSIVHAVEDLVACATGADALICTVPLAESTRGLVNSRVLEVLANRAVVVNVGRGPVIDTDALLREVESGRLVAALDVTDPEPLPDDHDLWQLPNVIVTPHVGGNTDIMLTLLHALIAAQIRRVARGEKPENLLTGLNNGVAS